MKILITGATGFVGKYLVQTLQAGHHEIITLVRKNSHFLQKLGLTQILFSNLAQTPDLKDIDVLIHLAGRAHILKEQSLDPLAEFTKANVDLTQAMLELSAQRKIKQFILMSSSHVYGSRAASQGQADNPYSFSKLEAEKRVKAMAKKHSFSYTILQPPLIYGPGVLANMRRLVNLVKKFSILPCGHIKNLRSMLYVGNLVSALEACLLNPKAANQTFVVTDQQDLSTTDLIKKIAHAMNKQLWLFPIPIFLVKLASKKVKILDQLWGNLQVDSSRITKTLGWQPPYTPDQGIAEMVNAFQDK